MSPTDPRHGTVAGAVAHKKLKQPMCDACSVAHSRYEKRRVVRMATTGPAYIDALGTRRRIEALMSLGWALSELDARLGRKKTYTHAILKQKTKVSRATAREIADLYEALSMTRPEGWVADRTRRIAAKNGYAPPLAYNNIDDPREVPVMDETFTRWDSIETRFWGRVEKTDECWLWTGKLTPKGYGQRIGHRGTVYYPHQLSYILHVGPIPSGLVIDHLCRVRRCVNPEHLEPVTALENTQRGVEARWFEPCPNGHDPSDRRTLPSGKNVCTECRRVSDMQRYARDKDKRRAAGRERWASKRRDILVEVDEMGDGITDACRAVGITRDGLEKWCERNGLTPLYSRLVDREQPRYWRNGGAEGGVA